MNNTHIIQTAILATTLMSWSPTIFAQGNLVVNGNFDTDASSWTMSDIGRDGGYYSGKGDPGGYFLLDNTPAPSLSPTISQVVDGLTVGDEYLVSGNYAWSLGLGDTLPTDTPSFGVAINGNFLDEATAQQGNSNWQSFSFEYLATDSSVTLSLSSQINGTEVSYGIDNIAMNVVPEPSAWSLMGMGSALFAFRRLTRRMKYENSR